MSQYQAPYKNIYTFLGSIMKPYRWWYVLVFQAPLISGIYFPLNNYAIKTLVNIFMQTDALSWQVFWLPIAIFVGAQFLLECSWRLSEIAAWHTEPYVQRDILLKTYDYIQHHSYRYFQNTPSGVIISKIKGLIDKYEMLFGEMWHTIGKTAVTTLFCVLSLAFINSLIFCLMVMWCVITLALMIPMSFKLHDLSATTASSKHRVIGLLSDNITNIFSLFYFAKRQREYARAKDEITKDYIPHFLKVAKYWFRFCLLGSILYCTMLIAIFFLVIWMRQEHLLTAGDVVFVLMTVITISFELWNLTCSLCDLMKNIGDFRASFSILTEPHDLLDLPIATAIDIKNPSIIFKNVSFGYDSENMVFKELSFSIPPGQHVGVVGHSGAGKSTLIGLILKNMRAQQGEILIDERPIDHYTADSIRSQIALIPQDILLFHRSIAENIGYAKDNVSLKEIQTAAKLAHIHDFIESLPEKYDTMVGERGMKLSGGQRQRIAIARALLKHTPFIILDEATASLDTQTEKNIQESINGLLNQRGATVLAIAHRLSTIRHLDRILVMVDGKIVEDGSFAALMQTPGGRFKHLWESQVNGMI